ncbi:MAG: TolC family protein [Deltaproteobacteria bacterium]|nr:TolC family protein [Deltaproteobacteria bacterium]
MKTFFRALPLLLLLAAMFCLVPAAPLRAASPPAAPTVLTLDAAIGEALRNYPLLQAAMEKQLQAEEAAREVSTDLLPKLNTSYSYFRLHSKPYGFFGPAGKIYIGDDDVNTWRISAVQPLFTGFALTTRKKMAGLEITGRQLEKEQLAMDVVKNVKVAYYRVFLARERLAVAQQQVKNLAAHEHDTVSLYQQGMIPYNDLLQARVALAQARQYREKTRRDLDLARSALNLLMNHDLRQQFELEKLTVEPRDDGNELEALFKEALANRPEISHLQLRKQQAQLAVTMARSRYYPQVSLVGSYEQSGDDFGGRHNSYRNSDTAAVGIQADWTFFEWGKTRAAEKRNLHQLQALEQKIAAVQNQIRLEVQTASSGVRLAAVNTRTAAEAVAQAEENYRITNVQYQQQMATSTTLLDAVTFLTRARNSYYEALYGYLIARAELERSLGQRRLPDGVEPSAPVNRTE